MKNIERLEKVLDCSIKQEPMLSVFVITFQHAAYIRQALDGILMQKVDFPFEICIGEDGSSDGTRELCQMYADKYPEYIRLFLRNRNNIHRKRYVNPAMFNQNETLAACCGKYIALCEGDDYWTDPLKLQKQVDFLEAHPEYALCFHDRIKVDERGTIIDDDPLPQEMKRDLSHDEIAMSKHSTPPTATLMLRRSAIASMPDWFTQMPYGDRGLAIVATQQGSAGYIDMKASAYRIHPGGIASGASGARRAWMDIKSRQIVLANVPMSRQGRRFHVKRIMELYCEAWNASNVISLAERKKLISEMAWFIKKHPQCVWILLRCIYRRLVWRVLRFSRIFSWAVFHYPVVFLKKLLPRHLYTYFKAAFHRKQIS
ncbi:MAG: glycosyltransferase [Kiritimatiellae bacterium]|nr:glycosyltransferase [Kiritimatiellia bacterium]